MKEVDQIVDALARADVEETAEVMPEGLTWNAAVSRLHAAGETATAAKLAMALRHRRVPVSVPASLEPAIRRAQAENAAEVFGRVNKANGTNDPLPAWVRAELAK